MELIYGASFCSMCHGITTYCTCLFGQWAAAYCGTLPNATAGQYVTSNCKPLLFRLPCKWQYINAGTFNLQPLHDGLFIAQFQTMLLYLKWQCVAQWQAISSIMTRRVTYLTASILASSPTNILPTCQTDSQTYTSIQTQTHSSYYS